MSAMDDEILLRFLAIGVIDVGGDDTKLEKLRATVTDLSSALKKTPAKTPLYTMVAADPDVPATDPTVQEAMAVLKKHWTTVANTFSSTPVAIIRAMLLDAVVQSARLDDAIAVAFVNSARNALPYVESGNEQPIWQTTITEIETKVDTRAESEWATPEMISIRPLDFKAPDAISIESKSGELDRETLKAAVTLAAGPWAGGKCNPHWVHQQPQHWGTEFASRLSTAIADVVDEALDESGLEPVDLGTPLGTLAKAVSTHVEAALAAFSGATAGLQRRTNLLWWKEALYSPSAHVSYRDLPVFEAAALMALDLYEQVPTYSPASVSAFLNEAIQMLPTVADAGDEAILTLVEDARGSALMEPLREVAAQLVVAAAGRGPLLSLIGHATEPALLDARTLHLLCGVNADVAVSPPAWGTWLFRELQAARATTVSSPKRLRRKVG
ncbi:MAG: GTPase-associated system all-helical protein GASH [Moraxellaceae bacterium]